jgi:pectate lyase
MPRTRFGQVHVFNNYYSSVGNDFCVGAGIESLVRLEGNFFAGVEDPHQFQDDSSGAQLFVPLTGANANFYGGATSLAAPYETGGDSFNPPYTFPRDPGAAIPTIVEAGAGPQ